MRLKIHSTFRACHRTDQETAKDVAKKALPEVGCWWSRPWLMDLLDAESLLTNLCRAAWTRQVRTTCDSRPGSLWRWFDKRANVIVRLNQECACSPDSLKHWDIYLWEQNFETSGKSFKNQDCPGEFGNSVHSWFMPCSSFMCICYTHRYLFRNRAQAHCFGPQCEHWSSMPWWLKGGIFTAVKYTKRHHFTFIMFGWICDRYLAGSGVG